MKRVVALLLIAFAVALAAGRPETALGHAALRTSDPAANAFLQRAPGQVTLTFTEPITSKSSTIQLLDAAGKPITIPDATVSGATMSVALPQLQPGIYNVLWANVSRIDGHAIRGSYPFTVLRPDGSLPAQTNSVTGLSGDADPPPLADGVAVRALSLLGLAMVVAGAMVTLLWSRPGEGIRKGLEYAVYGGSGVLVVATALNFVTIHDAYDGVGARELIFETQSGGYWMTRAGIALLVGVAASFLGEAPRRTAVALMGCVGVYLWAYTATSHAAASTGSAWARGLDFVHGMAALTWIGAVVGVAVAARLGSRHAPWRELMSRFSLTASAMVFLLLATGFLSGFVEVDAMSKLWETRYGAILVAKLVLMVPLLGVAAYNAKVGRARLERQERGEPRRFVISTTVEVILGLGVFLAAAALTQTTVSKSIAIQPERKPFDQVVNVADLQVRLTVDPNQTGLNTYRVELDDAAGNPVSAERVRLTFRYQDDANIGASTLTLAGQAEGVSIGQGPFMTLEGRWRIETEVRRANVDDAIAFFDVRPSGTAVVSSTTGGAWSKPTPGLTWNQFGGLAFVLAGLGFAFARTPVRRLGKSYGWAASGATMTGFSLGVLLLFGVHAHEPSDDLPTNPVYPDANSIAQGRTLFDQNCASCHGRTGVPPKGLDLDPYPLDLTVHVPQHADGQLYKFIADGVPGTAMRAWDEGDGRLTEEQIWHLVNFLRTLTPVER